MQDLTGKKFGRWKVITFSHRDGARYYWECRCVCGSESLVDGGKLRRGLSKSCGCARTEQLRKLNTTHGQSKTPEYWAWWHMLDRCYNTEAPGWVNYGGRGIKVCRRWHKFENFLADMGERPSKLSLERRDNEIGYNPKNCYWASRKQQARNRRSSRVVTFGKETKVMTEWAELQGINLTTVYARIARGQSEIEALELI